jgi:hypothetical protein
MTLFNFGKWAARQVTDSEKNVDLKIFIIGGPGTGKSKTGLALAKSVRRWTSFFLCGDFDHAEDYFSFDEDHIAVIDTNDLVNVMIKKLRKHSTKIVDDCGTAKGINARTSMTEETQDIVSIYGTNRTDNGITIICVQDTTFADKRMRMLADVVIDLTDYYQEGPFRMAKLSKIRMDSSAKYGIRKCRFMTYEHGEWLTVESIACFMPDLPNQGIDKQYNDLRKIKQDAQSLMIAEKFKKASQAKEVQDERPRCPYCNSTRLYHGKSGQRCNNCGKHF